MSSTDNREHMPNPLVRQIMLECGYRCAMCKSLPPLEIDHIEEYSEVHEHKFENLIALCPTCHTLKKKSSDPRHINRASLKKRKADLMMLSARYSDMERRYLEEAQERVKVHHPDWLDVVRFDIHHSLRLMFKYLHDDGLIKMEDIDGGMSITDGLGRRFHNDQIRITLTREGFEFVSNLNKSM